MSAGKSSKLFYKKSAYSGRPLPRSTENLNFLNNRGSLLLRLRRQVANINRQTRKSGRFDRDKISTLIGPLDTSKTNQKLLDNVSSGSKTRWELSRDFGQVPSGCMPPCFVPRCEGPR
ncbi:hypothetical protein A2291_04585 [candidate division WOR-1 bacterium RIFOXYB2_FULL_42_35]|uniref:Uncharacterized protein n=1 Tax=candidate division WOR-1 bacterium RIFOXYC2_FULL_41_25 TaxID=1802586 RepID=A0A1F4TRV5_UNCSA|nr:MAG: hypothetical protein A2247_07700 [candidate division WOR-1 bacterium RIFOXYA2_FULL_41_14]OGC25841.1 MAG: hypothetical protein A2291_04585 [candidate division WOR-1 bacterium RIFOXYB2_FULL_42_35]OGC35280.1 MAG: hypothetical protein A2462_08575 [candidate division WOR-1 bacterium RIFOXYC2_FULL_41_25]OGC41636.1 MAG: hypothetical protein A2548_04720 [candidate division WOR-1 bacterium RIFOXYD2_FULL_41_8]